LLGSSALTTTFDPIAFEAILELDKLNKNSDMADGQIRGVDSPSLIP